MTEQIYATIAVEVTGEQLTGGARAPSREAAQFRKQNSDKHSTSWMPMRSSG
jgi:hypothetical protein